MHLRLHGKVAMVAGASRGLGFAMARALAGAGAELVLNTEELVFYKSREEYDYRRYYGLREVETMLHDS